MSKIALVKIRSVSGICGKIQREMLWLICQVKGSRVQRRYLGWSRGHEVMKGALLEGENPGTGTTSNPKAMDANLKQASIE